MNRISRRLAVGLLTVTAGVAGTVAAAPSSMANPETNFTTITASSPSLVSSTATTFAVSGTVTSQYDCTGTVTLTQAKYVKSSGTYVAQASETPLTQTVTSTAGGAAYSISVGTAGKGNSTWQYTAEFTPAGPCVGDTSDPTYTTVKKLDSKSSYTRSRNGSSANYTYVLTVVDDSSADKSKYTTPSADGSVTITYTTGSPETLNVSGGTVSWVSSKTVSSVVYNGDEDYNGSTATLTP